MIYKMHRLILMILIPVFFDCHVTHARLHIVLPGAAFPGTSDTPAAATPAATFSLSFAPFSKTLAFKAFKLPAASTTTIQPATTPAAQASALLAGKASCLQDSKGKLSSWTAGTDHCSSWKGVKCDKVTGLVKELELDEMGLAVSRQQQQ
jgi:hypothetical protein